MRTLACAIGLGVALSLPAPVPAASSLRFPFRTPSLSGGIISSEDFKGKIVVVDVWATWCVPCRVVIPHLVKLHGKYKDKGVVVVGLSTDEDTETDEGRENVRKFTREMGIDYPIGLMNPETYLMLARVMGFNLEEGFSIPTTLVVGRNGMVLKRYPGYFYGQEEEIEKLITGILESEAKPPGKP